MGIKHRKYKQIMEQNSHIMIQRKKQGAKYVKRSNNIPMAVLGYMTPKEKRKQLEIA